MTSRGQVITCSQVLETSADWRTEQVSAQVSWFVDGRDWRRVLVMEPGGVVLAGSRENLYRKLETGASLRLGLRGPEEYQVGLFTCKQVSAFCFVLSEVYMEMIFQFCAFAWLNRPHCLTANLQV